MAETFRISHRGLPPSINDYLKPTTAMRGGRHYAYLYETQASKDFKKTFGEKLKRAVKNEEWDISKTESNHWYIELNFVLPRMDADSHNYIKILIDSMTGILFIDDKNIQPRIGRVMYGKDNQCGFTIELHRTDYIGLFNGLEERDTQLNQCLDCRYYRDGGCRILKQILDGKLVEEFDMNKQECGKYIKKGGGK